MIRSCASFCFVSQGDIIKGTRGHEIGLIGELVDQVRSPDKNGFWHEPALRSHTNILSPSPSSFACAPSLSILLLLLQADDVLPAALRLADDIATNSPVAIRTLTTSLRLVHQDNLERAL